MDLGSASETTQWEHILKAVSDSDVIGSESRSRMKTLPILVEYKKLYSDRWDSMHLLVSCGVIKQIQSIDADRLFLQPWPERVYFSIYQIGVNRWCGSCDGLPFEYNNGIITRETLCDLR